MSTSVFRQRLAARKRGLSLAEIMLSLVLVSAMFIAMALNAQREASDQKDRMMAARTDIVTNSAKSYVGEQYDNIREELTTVNGAVDPSATVSKIMTLEELAEAGYFSDSLLSNSGGNDLRQDYRLFIRGVRRSDTSWPQATLNMGDLASLNVPDANGKPTLTNGIYSPTDDEMDLESVVITEGGDTVGSGLVALRRGTNITSRSGNPTMGFIQEEPPGSGILVATGNLGAFNMPIDPWAELGSTTSAGHFLTLVSLSDGAGGGGGGGSADLRGALRRCEDLTDPTDKETCLADGNKMYSNIVFNTTGAADYEEYPGIQGLKKVACREPDGGNRPSGPVDENTDLIYIDCADVRISDNLTVESGNLQVDQGDVVVGEGTVTINGNEISNNLIMAQGEGLNGKPLPAAPITDEVCPKKDDGTNRTFKVQAWVTGLIEPVGRPLAGYRISLRDDADPATGQFTADVIGFVNEDVCTNVNGTQLTPGNAARDMEPGDFNTDNVYSECQSGPLAGTDSYPDAYFLNDRNATIGYAVYCE